MFGRLSTIRSVTQILSVRPVIGFHSKADDIYCVKKINSVFIVVCAAVVACTAPADEFTYSGQVSAKKRLDEFTAVNNDGKTIQLTKSGPHELSFTFNDTISYLDYENDVIIIQNADRTDQWTARSIKNGFALEDGTTLNYAQCRGWELCLEDPKTGVTLLKGAYSLSGNDVRITLWISPEEKHIELLGLMANGLINRSLGAKESGDSSLKIIAAPIWSH